jgi:calcium-dependent protein kinase
MGACSSTPDRVTRGGIHIGGGSKFIFFRHDSIEDHYDIESEKLGEGGYGSVHRATHLVTHAERAIKRMPKNGNDVRKMKAEIDIMAKLDHPNIIKLYETFEDDQYLYIVMELCSGGDLFERTKAAAPFSEADAAIIIRQVLRCVNYLHERGICHRDLKLENFLFTSSADVSKASLKMIDFGLATTCKDGGQMTTSVGTPMYVAPEVLTSPYTRSCDLWSCGVILYILLSGVPPFKGQNKKQTAAQVLIGEVRFQERYWKNVSQGAKDLICKLLTADPRQRYTAEQALNNVWLRRTVPPLARVTRCPAKGLEDRLAAFSSRNKLAQAALLVSARELPAGAELEALSGAFLALDGDEDGQVSPEELSDALRRSGRQVSSMSDVRAIVDAVDENGNGAIDYTEFLAANLDSRLYTQEDLCRSTFHVFDLNGDGVISKKELKQVLKNFDADGADNIVTDVAEILQAVDRNCDGSIDFSEYMAMMQGLAPPVKSCQAVYGRWPA